MNNIRPGFEVCEKDISELPSGYQKITCHMIFDVDMGKNVRGKARSVAYRHKTKKPADMTYFSVVYRYLVWIALTIESLNDLDVLA